MTTPSETPVVGAHRLRPVRPPGVAPERRHPVEDAVELIELVGELVKDHVRATGGIGDLALGSAPVEHDRTASVAGLTGEVAGGVADDATCRAWHRVVGDER